MVQWHQTTGFQTDGASSSSQTFNSLNRKLCTRNTSSLGSILYLSAGFIFKKYWEWFFFFLRIISPQTRGQTRGHSSGPNQDAVVPGTTTDRWLRITTFGQSASILTGVASLTFTKLVQRSRKPRDQLHALSIISGNQMCAPIIASQLQWDVQTQESVRKSEKFFHTAFPERKNVYCKTRALNQ